MRKSLGLFITAAVSLGAAAVFADEPQKSDAATPAEVKKAVERRFEESRKHFNENRLEAAAAGFRELSLQHSDLEQGAFSVNLYLEAVARILPTRNESQINEAVGTAAELHDLYCVRRKGGADKELCERISRTHCDLVRFAAERLTKQSGESEEKQRDNARAAGDHYFSLVRRYADSEERLRASTCGRMDEILYNAGMSYYGGGRAFESLLAFRRLADAKKAFPSSPLVGKAAFRAGGILISIGEYAEGAGFYERYARENPKEERADQALSDAIVLRLGLSEDKEAEQDAELFLKLFGAKKASESANIALAIGLHRIDKNDFQGAERQLSKSISLIDKSGALSIVIRGHAALGRAYSGLGRGGDADKQYQSVISIFRDPARVTERIMREEPSPGERQLGKALTALGEAHFYFAEKERQRASNEKLPLPKSKGDWNKYSGELQPVIRRRMQAIENAEKAYLKILNIQPVPPPQWVIAGASRVADMWADFSDEIQSIGSAMKKEVKEGEKKAVNEQFMSIGMPWLERAKQSAKTCINYSLKFQYTSEYSKRCEAWLTRHIPKEFPPIFELAPSLQFNATPFLLSKEPLLEPEKKN